MEATTEPPLSRARPPTTPLWVTEMQRHTDLFACLAPCLFSLALRIDPRALTQPNEGEGTMNDGGASKRC